MPAPALATAWGKKLQGLWLVEWAEYSNDRLMLSITELRSVLSEDAYVKQYFKCNKEIEYVI